MQLADKTVLRNLRKAMDDALQAVAEKFDLVQLQTGRITYDSGGIEAKIQVVAVARRADGKTKEQLDFEKYHEIFGLKPEHFGARFTSKSEEYKIAGLLPNRSKFPILGVNTTTGKRLLFTTDVVKRLQ